jgi:hypothetical protein
LLEISLKVLEWNISNMSMIEIIDDETECPLGFPNSLEQSYACTFESDMYGLGI